MRIAAIIPFRGDPLTLSWVLDGFASQEIRDGQTLDVRIYGDGVPVPALPPDQQGRISFTATQGPHVGVGEAKNALLRERPADVVLIANADTRPAPGFVQGHVQRLLSLSAGSMVLGAAPYEALASPTVFDALKEQTPMIFFYNQLRAGELYDFRHVWTLNLSVRYSDLERLNFFNPAFRPWGFEDLELGFRLMGRERAVYFDPAIQVTHRHPMVFEDYLRREELLGAMATVLHLHNPAAFAALYGTDNLQAMAAEYTHWVKMDLPSHAWIYKRLREWCELPGTELGTGDARQRLVMTLYQMHMPLKRLAFRLGFLWGLTAREDDRWHDRKPQNLWRQAVEV